MSGALGYRQACRQKRPGGSRPCGQLGIEPECSHLEWEHGRRGLWWSPKNLQHLLTARKGPAGKGDQGGHYAWAGGLEREGIFISRYLLSPFQMLSGETNRGTPVLEPSIFGREADINSLQSYIAQSQGETHIARKQGPVSNNNRAQEVTP
jgi:hypothetical protein